MALIAKYLRRIDPADVLLFAGLLALTAAAAFAHPAVALIVFGLGAFYLGLMAGRTPPKAGE